jgi:protein-L-isoaspartate(D-aspartate) O-methyltransferase
MRQQLTDREGFAAFVLRMRARGLGDQRLFSAIEATPRTNFVGRHPPEVTFGARTIPIECGEVVEGLDLQATLIAALELNERHRLLEIGTGSGFTAAVMARLCARVLTLDRYRSLVEGANARFTALGIGNAVARHADGRDGQPGDGSFDRIIVWAAFETFPRHFAERLSSNGTMIAPVGPGDGVQSMVRLRKMGSRFEREDLAQVRMQPLVEGVAASL